MNQEQFLQQVYPYIGGQANVGRWQASGDKLYITVKDRSMVDLASVRGVPGVAAAELGRSRLSITVQPDSQEELYMAKKGNYDELAKKIIALVGGEANIANVTHCITRLRFNLKDESKADTEAIRSTPGVVGVTSANGQYQVIIGAEVTQVYEKVAAQLHNLEGGSAAPAKQEGSFVSRLIDTITGIFTPILPPLTAAGMLKAVLAILVAFKLVDSASSTYQVINFMADATFYFLPILLANSAAKKLGCNPYLAMMLGGILIHPNFVSMVTASKETGDAITVFGLPIYNATYSSSVIPILLGVLLMSKVEPLANKFAPKAVRFFTAPLITMLVVGIATLCVLGPIGYVISNILASAINGLSAIAPWLAPTIIGALLPFLVMTGTHHALTPIGINNRMTIGFDTIIYPGQLASNIAQGAAALAVSFKTKNMELKELTSSTGITAVCGITEPVLYGVTMKIRTNMIAAMVGGGVGGFFMGLMNTKNYSGGSPGLLTLPSYIGLDAPMSNFYFACAGAAIAFVVGFVVSFILYKDPVEGQENA
ncbi:PTS transporter subunit EIIC [Faecalibacterium sp. An77]|uniref:PTS transporter subunit EIIC n=1 Tax=Faecalibacterium sp. An77 TaxID=1965655 RepID=UPI001FA8E1C2|nr:PTS transporter subunit EIIC [Faecalibacterium sp. An77]